MGQQRSWTGAHVSAMVLFDDADDRAVEPDSPDREIDVLNVRRDAACFQVDASIVIMSAEPPVMPSHSNALSAETGRARQRLADAHHDLAMIWVTQRRRKSGFCGAGAGHRAL
jgi:hypothetical protein